MIIREVDKNDPVINRQIKLLNKAMIGGKLPRTDGWWWVVYDNVTPVAYAGMVESTKYERMAYFVRAGVLAPYRGRGLQLELIKLREERAKDIGFKGAVTDTFKNIHSSNNLIRSGFLLFQPDYPWSFKNAMYWRKMF